MMLMSFCFTKLAELMTLVTPLWNAKKKKKAYLWNKDNYVVLVIFSKGNVKTSQQTTATY